MWLLSSSFVFFWKLILKCRENREILLLFCLRAFRDQRNNGTSYLADQTWINQLRHKKKKKKKAFPSWFSTTHSTAALPRKTVCQGAQPSVLRQVGAICPGGCSTLASRGKWKRSYIYSGGWQQWQKFCPLIYSEGTESKQTKQKDKETTSRIWQMRL